MLTIKKIAVTLSVVILSMCIFVGCSDNKNSEIVGKWIPTTASLNGETVQYSYLGLEDDYFGFTFSDNGKCTATLTGITGEGTYSFNGTSVDVTINDETQKLDYSNGTLTLTLNYDNDTTTFSFIKEASK